MEVVWANENEAQIEQELEDYRSVGVNVVLLKLEWRGHNGETTILNMPRLHNEFENWRQHAKVSVLLQDCRAPEWEIWSFPARVSDLPVRAGSTYKSEWSYLHQRLYLSFPPPELTILYSRLGQRIVPLPTAWFLDALPGEPERFPLFLDDFARVSRYVSSKRRGSD